MRLQAPTHKKHSKNTSLGGAKLLGEGADSIICARLPANVCAAYKFEAPRRRGAPRGAEVAQGYFISFGCWGRCATLVAAGLGSVK